VKIEVVPLKKPTLILRNLMEFTETDVVELFQEYNPLGTSFTRKSKDGYLSTATVTFANEEAAFTALQEVKLAWNATTGGEPNSRLSINYKLVVYFCLYFCNLLFLEMCRSVVLFWKISLPVTA
jgi:hypothetical protein